MKKLLAILLSALFLLAAAGCTPNDPDSGLPPDTSPSSGKDTAPPIGEEIVPSETGDTTPDTGTEPTPPTELPFTLKIRRPDVSIYEAPGYDNADTGTLIDIGTYTITELCPDDEGFLWGKLKSGLGWIDLDKAAAEAPHIPITMERITAKAAKETGGYMHVVEKAPHTQWLLLQPYETLTDVRVCFLDFAETGFTYGEPFYVLDTMTKKDPLVLGIIIYGDFTMYGITFTDASGAEQQYRIYESGRNGSIVMDTYTMETDK